MLGFGLRHNYPIPKVWARGTQDPLESLTAWLKDSDTALFGACAALGVEPALQLVCRLFEGGVHDEVALDHMLDLGYPAPEYVNSVECALRGRGEVRVLGYVFTGDAGEPWAYGLPGYGFMRATPERAEGRDPEFNEADELTVHWLTQTTRPPPMWRTGTRRLWGGCTRGFAFFRMSDRTGIGLGERIHGGYDGKTMGTNVQRVILSSVLRAGFYDVDYQRLKIYDNGHSQATARYTFEGAARLRCRAHVDESLSHDTSSSSCEWAWNLTMHRDTRRSAHAHFYFRHRRRRRRRW